MEMKKLRDQVNIKPLEYATTEKVDFLNHFVGEVTDALKEVKGVTVSFVSDESAIGDFLLTESEIKKMRKILGVPVFSRSYIVDIAQKIKDRRG